MGSEEHDLWSCDFSSIAKPATGGLCYDCRPEGQASADLDRSSRFLSTSDCGYRRFVWDQQTRGRFLSGASPGEALPRKREWALRRGASAGEVPAEPSVIIAARCPGLAHEKVAGSFEAGQHLNEIRARITAVISNQFAPAERPCATSKRPEIVMRQNDLHIRRPRHGRAWFRPAGRL